MIERRKGDGKWEIDEEAVKNNFVLIYELLDGAFFFLFLCLIFLFFLSV